jgi:hypothetical protein
MGVWQGVTMDSLKFHLGPPCLTLLCPAGRPPLKRQGRQPAAVFYPLGHPTLYAYERSLRGPLGPGAEFSVDRIFGLFVAAVRVLHTCEREQEQQQETGAKFHHED